MAFDPIGRCLLFIMVCLFLSFFVTSHAFFQAILMPPVAVFLARNQVCSWMVSLNILLTLIGWVPGNYSLYFMYD